MSKVLKIIFFINSIIFSFIFFKKFEQNFEVDIYNNYKNFYFNEKLFISFDFNIIKFYNNLTNSILLNKFKQNININKTDFNNYCLNNLPLNSKIIILFNYSNNYFKIKCKIIAPLIFLNYFSNQTYYFINNLETF